jgi:CHAT domain-containing protein/tetratricopeptide (TPR) repeat protein
VKDEAEHLSPDQIERLAGIDPITAAGTAHVELDEDARRHLVGCEACQKLVSVHGEFDRRLRELGEARTEDRSSNCPTESELRELACGVLAAGRMEQVLEHVTTCSFCAPLLRQAVADFDDSATPEEQALLAGLQSATKPWQQSVAARLNRESDISACPQNFGAARSVPWHRVFLSPRWLLGAATLAILASAAFWFVQGRPDKLANRLTVQAYTERRTLELRLPGAAYAPIQVNRGAEASALDVPQSLLDLKALVARNLRKHPTDPAWLQAKARADLLEWDYTSAIKELTRALAAQPDSPSLKADLAAAYFEQAKSLDRAIDYGSAIELLSQALAKNPRDPVILFNRALTYEQVPMLHEALADWEHYLELDPNGAWSAEARQHAEAIRQKLLLHDQSLAAPLLEIPAFVAAINPSDESTWTPVDARIEEYLDVSIQSWMPKAFPLRTSEVGPNERLSARRALSELAFVLLCHHRDRWLNDFLGSGPSDSLAPAVSKLGEAVRTNIAGNASGGRVASIQAQALFRQAGNRAGIMRAQLEEVYSLHRLFHGADCLRLATQLEQSLLDKDYVWIKSQLGLERFACFSSQTKMTRGSETISASLHLAEQSGYGTLYLRALGFAAAMETDNDNVVAAESQDQAGLKKYWSGAYPSLRAYQFYDDLTDHARQSEEWHFAAALGREATRAISSTPNRSGEGMARFRLAISSKMAGNPGEAVNQYTIAENIFASLPSDEENLGFRADSELQLAETEAMSGRTRDAETHLMMARSHLPDRFNSYDTWLTYYRTKAEVARLLENYGAMQAACGAAVRIGEWALSTISTEHDRVTWNHATARCYKTLVEAKLREHDFTSALELWEWYQGAAVRKVRPASPEIRFVELDRASVSPPNLSQVQVHLSDLNHETVLAYAELPNEVFAWAYDDRGIRTAQIQVTRTELERVTAEFAANCADPHSDLDQLKNEGRQLYDWLIAPFSADLDPSRILLIEADGRLASLPFQALIQPDGSYFGLQRIVAYSPGLEYMLRLRPQRLISSSEPTLVVGEPALSGFKFQFVPLPDANREAQEIGRWFPNSIVLTGKNATDQAILLHLPQSTVFHFAGHAIAGPEGTGLEVATKGQSATDTTSTLLSPGQIESAGLSKVRLAVLSGCSTGRPGGDGLADAGDIALAFLRNGVPQVVASRWTADSATTANLIRAFYSDLLKGNSAGQALMHATSKVSRTPSSSHPYFWASFGVFGRG